MDIDYQKLELEYARSPDQDARMPARHPVVVVGAGPVGLTVAIDLVRQGVPVVMLDDDHRLSAGSRAICFAKRALEIWDRLGCAERMVRKGVSWNVGQVFFGNDHVYRFDLLPESGHRRPAFINLQQYYCEGYLYEHARILPGLDLRWRNRVIALAQKPGRVALRVQTPEGEYALEADYVIACDGSRSPLRGMMGLESKGRVFRDRFLIADVRMQADFPTERWFWFDPPFHRNQSVLLHRQPDDVWRIDFQLGWEADPEEERKPERVIPRVRALLGEDARFDFEWISVYTFACQRMESFRHDRVIFAGDSAHGVSPFGARGANSGVQDADNLAWKLRLVLQGKAPDRLLDTYASEREQAADENILNSTRSTDFITPKSAVSRTFRDAVLGLAKTHPFARRLVNAGRLSLPSTHADSPLNTPDDGSFQGRMVPGAPALDAPITVGGNPDWLLGHLGGEFTGLYFADVLPLPAPTAAAFARLAREPIPVRTVVVVSANADAGAGPGATVRAPASAQRSGASDEVPEGRAAAEAASRSGVEVVEDAQGLAAQRYDARSGTFYLLRPDQHVCGRWRAFDVVQARAALARATCNE